MSDESRRASRMREDRPLDALFPELTHAPTASALALPAGLDIPSVHPRLLHVDLEEGHEWGLAVWHADAGTPALLQKTLDAALLRELSMPPGAPATHKLAGVHLASFAPLDAAPLRAMGFMPEEWDAEQWRDRMRALRQEAEALGLDLPDAPLSVWRMAVAPPPVGDVIWAIEAQLNVDLTGERWGDQPGKPSHRLVNALGPHLGAPIRPTLDSLDRLDAALISRQTRALRWLPPLVFQGLCDLVAVTWSASLTAEIQWALCDPTPDGGALPPQIRVARPGQRPREIALALVLLRLCVLPIDHPQAAPPLGEWLRALGTPGATD